MWPVERAWNPRALGPLGWLTAFLGALVAFSWAAMVLLMKANAGLESSVDICHPASFQGVPSAGWGWRVDWFPTETACWPRDTPGAAFVSRSHTDLTTSAVIALCLIAVGLALVVAGRMRRRQSRS